MIRPALILLAALAPFGAFAAMPDFVPLPVEAKLAEGRFKLTDTTAIVAPDALLGEANLLADKLRLVAGLPAPVKTSGAGIVLALDKNLDPEGYTLEIKPTGVTIKGGSPAGVFYGVQTFMQALPPAIFGKEAAPKADWSAPALSIADKPSTRWRGLMLDSARHFQPKEFVKKFIDAMAAQKLNRLHWHLVDSEGWRLEIKKYPKLTDVCKDAPAYFPDEIPTNPTAPAKYRYGTFHGGGHYTQDDIREIVAYAAARHVTIIPEIEFPGHAMVALTAYPEFSTTRKVPTVKSNISPDLIGVHPEALRFLRDVLDETMDLFPGKWIHFGGDEAPKGQWKNSPEVQAKIKELGLDKAKNPEEALQAWLFNEMAAHIAKRGRSAVGWEEIMHGENLGKLAKGSAVMAWLSQNNAVKSANAGLGAIFTSVGPFYLDSYQVRDNREPSALYGGPFTVEAIRNYNLFPSGLTAEGRKNVLGAQGQLWSELLPRTDDVEYQAFPRACGLAELTWTPPELREKTKDAFMERLANHGPRLTALGLNHRRVAPPPKASWSAAFLVSGQPWEFAVPQEETAKLNAGETLALTFKYTGGGNGLDIHNVELLVDGKPVASDKHAGFTGNSGRNNTYKVKLPAGTKSNKLSIRVTAKGAGGQDSHGDVAFSTSK